MSERVIVFTVGDRFATMAEDGEVHVWEIPKSGQPVVSDLPGTQLYKALAESAMGQVEPFVRGNDRLNRLLSDPEIAAGVAEIESEARNMEHAPNWKPGFCQKEPWCRMNDGHQGGCER